jgi:hypothetical protein
MLELFYTLKNNKVELDMKAIPFLLIVLIGLGAVYVWTISKNEGFAQYGSYAQKMELTGQSIDEDKAVEINIGKPKSSQGSLPNVASAQSNVGPIMSQNPDTVPPTLKELQNLKADISTFFDTKASIIEKQAFNSELQEDLNLAKDDKMRVDQEITVLTSNPGITPSINRGYYNAIKGQIDYLTNKANQISGVGLRENPLQENRSSWLQDSQFGSMQSISETSSLPVSRNTITLLLQEYENFMQNKYTALANQSDPTIQLPLSKFKADRERLLSEAQQGMPTLTEREITDLEYNLGYLNDKFIQLQRQGAGGSSILGTSTSTNGSITPNLFQQGERATLMDLKDARNRMTAEKARLGAAGSLDPVINARINSISNMITDIEDIIKRVESGSIMEIEIPIYKSELSSLFMSLGDTSKPIPQITTTSLPPELVNLLPPGVGKDPETQATIRTLSDKYVSDFLKGASFELGLKAKLKYTSENEALAGSGGNNTYNAFFGPLATGQDSTIARNSMLGTSASGFAPANEVEYTSQSPQMMPYAQPGNVTDPYAIDPRDGLRTPSVASGFDWKTRAKQICENARKMGLNPSDFGCMPDNTTVSPNFSWRGYTRMICNRLQTHYYTGTDVACGCPPINWPGWNSAAGETAL